MKFYFTLVIYFLLPFIANAQAPIEFIQNKGQWDGDFEYRANTTRGDVFLQKNGFTYLLAESSNNQKMDAFHHGQLEKAPILKYHAYKVTFEGAMEPRIVGDKPQSNYFNYFLGNDSSRWKTGIHPYYAIDYKGLYKGIDMHIATDKGNLVYDFIVQPRANPEQIQMHYKGAEQVALKKGNLIIYTSVGEMQELKPYAYQYVDGTRTEVECNYVLKDDLLTFSFPKGYDKRQTLVIDPTVVFCTFTGSTSDNWGFTATYDDTGNLYAGGIANGPGFPVTTGAFQMAYAGGYQDQFFLAFACDIAIIKYNPTGSNRIYATYIGGKLNERPHSMVVDNAGNLIIAGKAKSIDYPITSGAFQTTNSGGWDIIVSKLNSSGTALLGSTYVGGPGDDGVNYDSTEKFYGSLKYNYGDDARSEVQVDKTGNIYVTGCTRTNGFPTTPATALRTTLSGDQDGVVFKMNPTLTNMMWSTYLGGSDEDAGYVLAFDQTQQYLYVAGGTMSNNFPSTAGTWHNTYQGGSADGFIVKFLNSPPYSIQRSTYIGTNNYDQVYGIQVDINNDVYAMGQSLGGTFPVNGLVYSNPNSSQFILKMDNNLTTNVLSTVYGSGDPAHTNISPVAFLVDTCGNIYISGWGGNLDLPRVFGASTMSPNIGTTIGMPVTANARQATTDSFDFYFICLNRNMQNLLYASFFGSVSNRSRGEHVDGGTSRFDKNGKIYQAICAACAGDGSFASPFPTTPGSWSPNNGYPTNCNEAALKIDFELGPVHASAKPSPSTRGCAPFTVQFQNTSNNGVTFVWDFGDNSGTSTQNSPTHTYTQAGIYTVKLSVHNANACIILDDDTTLIIRVDTERIKAGFTYQIVDSCPPYSVTFANTSIYSSSPGSTTFTVFDWDFGDGNTYTGANPPPHTYTTDGTYTVKLTMTDTSACNSPETVQNTFPLTSFDVVASFTSKDTICKGESVPFNNTTTNGATYDWDFGDGNTSTSGTVTHTFDSAGIYTVKLVSRNPNSCNGISNYEKIIVVEEIPTADFEWTPFPPRTNIPITFTNLSTNALTYLWEFGDGEQSKEVNPVHEYRKTNTFSACLTSKNLSNCPARICKDVPTDIVSLADLPTGFSPNGDGANDVLYVRGANIQTMNLKIYNRWGQLVFETNDQNIGWDGTFNGKPQEMEAYAFVLEAKFWDGGSLQKQGNVTLLR